MEDRKDDMLEGAFRPGDKQKNKKAYRRPPQYFKGVHYDEEGRYLILHHDGALKYYRINVAILFLFLGVTLYNYVNSP